MHYTMYIVHQNIHLFTHTTMHFINMEVSMLQSASYVAMEFLKCTFLDAQVSTQVIIHEYTFSRVR